MNRITALAAAAMLLAGPVASAIGSSDEIRSLYKNCTNLHKKHSHGLGKVGARDGRAVRP